jgi:wyosine [tRNA(Phe)-imidazoG37] synthetase (radical SAM superfamily)
VIGYNIKTIYGIHPSRCFGLSLGIDPLLPPKKCPYNCIYCPIGYTVNKTMDPKIHVSVERVGKELSEFINANGCVFENVMIWGSGDPLLNYQTPLIIGRVREILREYRCESTISIRTTGYLLGMEWVIPLYNLIDYIIIPLDAAGDARKFINEPLDKAKLSILVNTIREIPGEYRRRIFFEINLLRIDTFRNTDPPLLDELSTYIEKTRVNKILLKTINRPSWRRGIKPIRGRLFERVREYLENKGFIVKTCTSRGYKHIVLSGDVEELLFNHLLRKPLSTEEIRSIYGTIGVLFAEKLVRENIAEKTPWGTELFFRLKKTFSNRNK